jgi:hypothetical protein
VKAHAVRKILLIQAIEETDRKGEALSLAERVEATRAVIGKNPPTLETQPEAPLSSATEWFLVRRADVLLRSLRERSPGIDHVLAVAGGAIAFDRGLLVVAFACGVLLSFLDGRYGINILAPPLICLVLWNVLAYLLMLGRRSHLAWLAGLYSRWARSHFERLLNHSTRFNAPLAPGLRRFAGDWWEVAQPLFAARGRRLMHFCAVLVALGLVAGYYFRAHVLLAHAGWADGNFFGSMTAHAILTLLYGPGALLAGIALPTTEGIAQLRWTVGSHGGGDATVWVHLIAWTALLYIVLPRLLAVLFSTFGLWRLSHRLSLPVGVATYVRTVFAAERFEEPHDV